MGLSLGRTQTSNTSVRLSQATLKLVPGVSAELDKVIGGTIRKVDCWNTVLEYDVLAMFASCFKEMREKQKALGQVLIMIMELRTENDVT